MLKESYVAKLKTLPKNTEKIDVGYPSVFAPPEDLLSDFNELKWDLMKEGKDEQEARRRAWEQSNFDKRYRKKIMSNPRILKKLKEIKKIAEKEDVYLYCYCGKSLCPRFILMDIIRNM